MDLREHIFKSFCWAEYFIAAVLTFVFSLSMYAGLVHFFGPEDKYADGYGDSRMYDAPNEKYFLTLLHDWGISDKTRIKKELEIYRYHHSWWEKFDIMTEYVWMILSFGIVTIAMVRIFNYYRQCELREKFDSWLNKL